MPKYYMITSCWSKSNCPNGGYLCEYVVNIRHISFASSLETSSFVKCCNNSILRQYIDFAHNSQWLENAILMIEKTYHDLTARA